MAQGREGCADWQYRLILSAPFLQYHSPSDYPEGNLVHSQSKSMEPMPRRGSQEEHKKRMVILPTSDSCRY